MKKIAILKLDGTLEQGCQVNLTIAEEGKPAFIDLNSSLSANLTLLQAYQQWQSLYRSLDARNRITAVPESFSNVSKKACQNAAIDLKNYFKQWLLSDSFRDIRDKCIEQFSLPSEEIRVIVCTACPILQRLPWHQWDLVERYDKVEIAISSPNAEYQEKSKQNKFKNKVRILAILGDSQGIDVEKDRETLKKLEGVKITFLDEPKQSEISYYLWQKSWDILFFAGHSKTQDQSGLLYINATESLTIEDLKYGLSQAIKHGLQLAIFNSCDGLGLAWELQELQIPQVIVMSEPVPDLVAQTFLKHFLTAFANDQSLYQSVKIARQKIHGDGLENQYPCASWLPTIVQNTSVNPPTWNTLQYGNLKEQNRRIAYTSIIASVVITILTIGVRSLGLLQGWELNAYDQFTRLKPDKGQDPRILVIEIGEQDLQYQIESGFLVTPGSSISDEVLAKLLKIVSSSSPRAIGLDIYRDHTVTNSDLINQYQNPNFFAVCLGEDDENSGIAPPKSVPEAQIGFSDVVFDDNMIVRRYMWSANFSNHSLCQANISLSLQLSLHYLQAEGIIPKTIGDKDYLQIGDALLTFLEFPASGYQGDTEENNKGVQILLNYRTRDKIAQSFTLTRVLEGKIDPNLFKDRIVLIGVINREDVHLTPFSQNFEQKMSGVYIQAQMVSQLLSAALEGEPLLSVWHPWADNIWILGWATVGGVLAWRYRQLKYLLAIIGIVIVIIAGVCFILFVQGWWVPLIPSELALLGTAGIVLINRLKIA